MNNPRFEWVGRLTVSRGAGVCLALAAALVPALPGGAQNPPAGSPQAAAGPYISRPPNTLGQFDNDDPIFTQKRLQAMNADRQKHLVSDAARLLKLASELNDEVRGAKSDALTPAQLRKVAEIEKLARSVREKMTYTMGDMPTPGDDPRPWNR
ncbi:MAG: hypothetical protein ABR956_00590 [Terracidiphilus sp.]|jgi:hypothetical protein